MVRLHSTSSGPQGPCRVAGGLEVKIYYMYISKRLDFCISERFHTCTIYTKVGRSKPPPVLNGGFNWFKPPRSICQKVVNMPGQYKSEWSMKFLNGRFGGGLSFLVRFYVLFIEKRKMYCFVPAVGTFYLNTDFCITAQGSNTSLLNF